MPDELDDMILDEADETPVDLDEELESEESDEDEIVVDDEPEEEPDEPAAEPPPPVEEPKPEPEKEPNVNEKALSSLLDERVKEFVEAYKAEHGFEPIDDSVFTFRYSEERAIRAELAAEIARASQVIESIRASVPQYEQEFQRIGAPKSAATHLVRIAEEYGGATLSNPKALADAKAMAIGRALLAEGAPKQKQVLPKGETPASKPTGYSNAERTAIKEMKASGLPVTRKSLKEWMAYGA